MKKERKLIRHTYKFPSLFSYDNNTTTVSFIPVCDNCNYVFDKFTGQVGVPYIEPCVCPNCHKIIECAQLPALDANGKLNYEEN